MRSTYPETTPFTIVVSVNNKNGSETVIEAIDLTKTFHGLERPAVDHLNLTIKSGQLYGLVGPDGAGKTTLLRMISSVLQPNGGSVHLMGFDAFKESKKIWQLIGYMPQNFSLYPDLSVLQNLEFFADMQGLSAERKHKRIPEMLEFTRLTEFTQRRAGALSGGMKKKLALACALVHEPKVLILDEPSTGVDPVSRRELWVILAQVIQLGVSVLVSTPYMDEAERCHEVAMLYQGHILDRGTPNELKAKLPYEVIEAKSNSRKGTRSIAGELPGIVSWRPVGDQLRLLVDRGHSDEMIENIDRSMKERGLEVKHLRKAHLMMEDVFVYMVEKEENR